MNARHGYKGKITEPQNHANLAIVCRGRSDSTEGANHVVLYGVFVCRPSNPKSAFLSPFQLSWVPLSHRRQRWRVHGAISKTHTRSTTHTTPTRTAILVVLKVRCDVCNGGRGQHGGTELCAISIYLYCRAGSHRPRPASGDTNKLSEKEQTQHGTGGAVDTSRPPPSVGQHPVPEDIKEVLAHSATAQDDYDCRIGCCTLAPPKENPDDIAA